jgi:hypothetical protein
MPAQPSPELRWFLDMADVLAEFFRYRWIAIDYGQITEGFLNAEWNGQSIRRIVIADADTFDEVLVKAAPQDLSSSVYYAFVEPPLETPRQG